MAKNKLYIKHKHKKYSLYKHMEKFTRIDNTATYSAPCIFPRALNKMHTNQFINREYNKNKIMIIMTANKMSYKIRHHCLVKQFIKVDMYCVIINKVRQCINK